jgi:hypothetical protein
VSTKSLGSELRASFSAIFDGEDRFFSLALIVSLSLHSLSLLTLLFTQKQSPQKKFQKIEVVYQAAAAPLPETAQGGPDPQPLKERKATPSPQILAKKGNGPAALVKDMTKSPSAFKLHSKQPSKLNLHTKRQVSISVGTDKITNPQYLSYQDRIRERISNRAHSYVDHPDFEVGTVQVTFILLADGNLKDVKIIDEKTKANDYLRSISLRSIKESSPFPVFPGELKYPELPFSIEISYEER